MAVGRRVIWLHTYGERFADALADRPPGPPRLPGNRRPKVAVPISDDPSRMPEDLTHLPGTGTLLTGTGRVAPVSQEVVDYEVSGMNVLRKWFGYRKRDPEGRRVSALDRIVIDRWEPALTTELLDLLNVLGLVVDLEPRQAALLDQVMAGPLVDVAALTAVGVLPPAEASHRPPAPDVDPGRPQASLI